jgi:trimeric autotransporter adhesin
VLATNSGAAYVYVRGDDGKWTQQAYLKASNTGAGDEFGFSVAISGDTIVVGACKEASKSTGIDGAENDNSALNAGAAYVFVRDGITWTQEAYLKASNAEAGDLFGYSVAIDGETLVVGAIGESSASATESDNTATQAGAAYVFSRNAGQWSQDKFLKASNADRADRFGISVDISGGTIVVGASGESSGDAADQASNTAGNSGAAYVFALVKGVWKQDGYLKASNIGASDLFGRAVAVSGNTIVVGSYQESGIDNLVANSGAAYVYTRATNAWTLQQFLKPSHSAAFDHFGIAVDIADETLVVGASGRASKTGTASVFVRAPNADNPTEIEWSEQSILTGNPAGAEIPVSVAGDNFGAAVSISGRSCIVGAWGQKGNGSTPSGAVYGFEGLGPRIPKIIVQDGFGTQLKSGDTITFAAAATDVAQSQIITIENAGIVDLSGITISAPVPDLPGSSSNKYQVEQAGTKTVIQPLSDGSPDNFTSFKITMTGSGVNTATLTITSNDPYRPSITLKLASRSFSMAVDTDGDGLKDLAEYQLRSLGFKWDSAQAELVKTLKNNASLAGLYDANSSRIKLDVPVLVKNSTTDLFTLTIGIQRSYDLEAFQPFPMTDSQVFINSQGKLEFRFASLKNRAFYRLQTE